MPVKKPPPHITTDIGTVIAVPTIPATAAVEFASADTERDTESSLPTSLC